MLMKFFINPDLESYLRGLASEFDVSTNAIRQELNQLEKASIIAGKRSGNKKLYTANPSHPLFNEVRRLLLKTVGIDQVMERIVKRLGNLKCVYLTGALARGKDSPTIDLYIIGDIDREYLFELVEKAEKISGKKIRLAVFKESEWNPNLLESETHVPLFEKCQ